MIHFIHNKSDIFAIYIFVNAGVIYEPEDKLGMSHMLEHMMFKRTNKFSGDDILRESTRVGGSFNAVTDKDTTYYYMRSSSSNYKAVLTLMKEIVLHPRFTQSDFDKERKVVLEEMYKTFDDERRGMWNLSYTSVLKGDNPYNKKVIGKEETLMNISLEDLKHYFDKFYTHYHVLVNCEKKYKQDILLQLKDFTDKNALQLVPMPLNTDSYSRKIIVIGKGSNQNKLSLTFPMNLEYRALKDVIILEFISFILTGAGLYSILNYEFREKRNLVYGISSYCENMRYLTLFRVVLSSSHNGIIMLIKLLLSKLNAMKKGLKPDKLRFFKRAFVNSMKMMLTDENNESIIIGTYLTYSNGQIKTDSSEIYKTIKCITNDDIKQMSNKIFNMEKLGLLAIGDFKNNQELADLILREIRDNFM